MGNTKEKGNQAEAAVMAEFLKHGVSVPIPFGNNEPYDMVISTKGGFKSVQVKYASLSNSCVKAFITKHVGSSRIRSITYDGLADYIALWCPMLNTFYLLSVEECKGKKLLTLRIDPPKNNSAISTVVWAKDHLFENKLKKLIAE